MWLACHLSSFSPLKYSLSFKDFYKIKCQLQKLCTWKARSMMNNNINKVHIYIYIYVHTYVHTHTYIHTYKCTHIHAYPHAHIHTHIYTYVVHTYIHEDIHKDGCRSEWRGRERCQSDSEYNRTKREIRKRLSRLEGTKWKIEFSWVKVHAGMYGNEMADRVAKETARSKDAETAFKRIPISTFTTNWKKKPNNNGKKNGKSAQREQ